MKRSSRLASRLIITVGLALAASTAPADAGELCEVSATLGIFGELVHWDKIIFTMTPGFRAVCPDGTRDPDNIGPAILNQRDVYDIKVPDDPNRYADVKLKVVNFLTNLGCTRVEPPDPITPS